MSQMKLKGKYTYQRDKAIIYNINRFYRLIWSRKKIEENKQAITKIRNITGQ